MTAAEVRGEAGRVDLGTVAAGLFQLDGWSWNERAGSDTTLAWGVAPRSGLNFFLAEVRDLPVRMRCLPYEIPGEPPQVVTVEVNGRVAGRLELGAGWQERELVLPKELLRRGDNELVFSYSRAASPESLGRSSDGRWLAVAWDWVELGAASVGLPDADPDRALLSLPPATQVDFFLRLESGGRFTARLAREGATAVEVEALTDGAEAPERVTLTNEDRAVDLPLGAGITRLRLTGRAGAGEGRERPAVLADPVVTAEAPPRSEESRDRSLGLCRGGSRPDVFVYLIDTLRADRLSVYGHDRPVSPALEEFAGDAVVFEQAIAQSSWTKASVASIMTGLWPWVHGVNGLEDRLPDSTMTLPRLLQAAGYRTAAVVSNPHISETFGFTGGFDEFVELGDLTTPAAEVHAEMLSILDRLGEEERVFGYLHTIDPHAPYAPPTEFRETFAPGVEDLQMASVESLVARERTAEGEPPSQLAALESLYDAEIAYNDEELGNFFDELRRRGRFDDALIVVVSDHGEEFFDHGGFLHGQTLYGEVVGVPLLIKFPGSEGAGKRWPWPVQHIDLLPTVAECADFDLPANVWGQSLASSVARATPTSDLPVFSYLHYSRYDAASVVLGDWKLVAPNPAALEVARELYDLRRDPGERHDLSLERPVVAGYLASLLRQALATRPTGPAEKVEIDSETERRLRALGYLE